MQCPPGLRFDRGTTRAHGIVQACLTRQILVLADRAYQGAGATVRTPYYGHRDHARLRAPGEHAFAGRNQRAVHDDDVALAQPGQGLVQAGRPRGEDVQGLVDAAPGGCLRDAESGTELGERLVLAQVRCDSYRPNTSCLKDSCATEKHLRTMTRAQRSAETRGRLSTMPVQEQDISRIWADVIGIPEADVDTNFFDLGGHSLQLMQLADRLNQKLGIDADVLMLMEYPTVATFTSHWNSMEALAERDR